MSLPLKLDFSNYDKFLTDPNYTTSAEAQDYFRNMDMLVEALIDVGLWQPETNYPNGHVVFSPNMPNGTEAVCVATTGGKSSNREPSWGEVGGDNVSDGTCFWKLRWKHWSKSVEEIADLTTGATNRLPNKAYAVGNVVYTDSNLSVALRCTTAGTTSNTELDISGVSAGKSVEDGSVVWRVVKRDLTDSVQANTNKFADYLPTSVNPIKNASISGKVITLTFANGTTKTLITQDTVPTNVTGAYKIPYATSSTAYNTGEKVATITNGVTLTLVAGARVAVKFTSDGYSSSGNKKVTWTSLNVNSTGAEPIKAYSRYASGDNEFKQQGGVYEFVYDGTNWNLVTFCMYR